MNWNSVKYPVLLGGQGELFLLITMNLRDIYGFEKSREETSRDLTNINRLGALVLNKSLFYYKLKITYDVDSMNKKDFDVLYMNYLIEEKIV